MTGSLHWFAAGFLAAFAALFLKAHLFTWAAWCAVGAVTCILAAELLARRRRN